MTTLDNKYVVAGEIEKGNTTGKREEKGLVNKASYHKSLACIILSLAAIVVFALHIFLLKLLN